MGYRINNSLADNMIQVSVICPSDQGSVEKNIEALIEALILKKGMLTSFILREVSI